MTKKNLIYIFYTKKIIKKIFNNINYLKYLKIKNLLKILKYIDLIKYSNFIIEKLYSESLIKTTDLVFLNYLKWFKNVQIVKKYNKLNDITESIIDHYIYLNNKICLQFLIENKIKINKTEWALKIQ